MHFKNVSGLDDLKQQYRKLAMRHHPDAGGNTEVMKEVNGEYDVLFPVWQKRHNQTATAENTETAQSTRRDFYTQNGWQGDNYDRSLSTTDIAKLIRHYVKQAFPLHKFSVTRDYNSIHVALMEAPHSAFVEGKAPADAHIQNAPAYFEQKRWAHGDKPYCVLTEQAIGVLKDVQRFINLYRRDDSDSMIDYFSTNFYSRLDIGKWDKPFKVVEKTLRVNGPDVSDETVSLTERLRASKQAILKKGAPAPSKKPPQRGRE